MPVETQILRVDPQNPEPEAIAQAAELVRRGGLVAFPTETVYGLGANALDEKAVAGIFAAKRRPADDPIIVHLASAEELNRVVASVPPAAKELARRFWPGPLTLVLPKKPVVPDLVTAGLPTVAARVPDHPVALALIREAGVPIAAPSANLFGRPSPTTAEHVLEDLAGRVEIILDAGPTPIGVESTVLDLTRPVPTILRPGGLPREALEEALGEVRVEDKPVRGPAPSPGMLDRHYAPRAPLTLVMGDDHALRGFLARVAREAAAQGRRVGLIVAEEDIPALKDAPAVLQALGSLEDPAGVARRLFSALRVLDALGVQEIYARDFGESGLALAVRNRLMRAAGGRVLRV